MPTYHEVSTIGQACELGSTDPGSFDTTELLRYQNVDDTGCKIVDNPILTYENNMCVLYEDLEAKYQNKVILRRDKGSDNDSCYNRESQNLPTQIINMINNNGEKCIGIPYLGGVGPLDTNEVDKNTTYIIEMSGDLVRNDYYIPQAYFFVGAVDNQYPTTREIYGVQREGNYCFVPIENTDKDVYFVFYAPPCGVTVTFNFNGHGDTSSPIPDQPLDMMSSVNNCYVIRPTDPTDSQYIFNGWYTDSACTNLWNFNNRIIYTDLHEILATGYLTLYAGWSDVNEQVIGVNCST